MFIHSNLFQRLEFPKTYPALIQVHLEHPAMEVPLHWHPGAEIIYSRNKRIRIVIDGEKIDVKPGEFVLISSFALHAVEPEPDMVHQDVMSITFQCRYLEQMFPEISNYIVSERAPGVSAESKKKMQELLEQLRQNVELPKKYFVTNKILFEILNLMYTEFRSGLQETDSRRLSTRSKMLKVLEYVDKNYRQPLTTQAIAEQFGYTREYFCRIFKEYSNLTFKNYLTSLRLSAAVQEIVMSDRGIGQIAMEYGFSDEKSFFGAFKKKYGMTPAQYRQTMGKQ